MIDFLNNQQQTDSYGETMGNSPEFLAFHRKLQCYDDTLHFCPFSAHKLRSRIYQGIFALMGLFFLALAWWISRQGICFFYFGGCENIKGFLYLLCGSLAALNLFVAWQMRGFREAFRKVSGRGRAQLLAVRRHKEQGFRCQGLQGSAAYQNKVAAFLHSFHRAEQQSLQYATQTYLILLHIEAAKLLTPENKERLIDQSLIDLHAALNNIAISFDSDS